MRSHTYKHCKCNPTNRPWQGPRYTPRWQRLQCHKKGFACGRAAAGLGLAGPWVDAPWLLRNIEDVRTLDARGSLGGPPGSNAHGGPGTFIADYDAYLEGHIPGAVFFNWTRDGAAWRDGGSELGGPEQLASEDGAAAHCENRGGNGGDGSGCGASGARLLVELDPDAYVPCLEARGVSADLPVVIYDDGASLTAARVWWQLLLYGHPTPYILYGGLEAWRAAGGASELYEPCPLKLSTTYEAEQQPRYRASAREFADVVAAGATPAPGGAEGSAGKDSTTLAVLLLEEVANPSHASAPIAAGGTVIRLTLSALLGMGGSTDDAADAAADESRIAAAVHARALRAVVQSDETSLAQRLSRSLGVQVGRGSSVRVLLASPHDCATSACVAAAALTAAGHRDWAVCEAW